MDPVGAEIHVTGRVQGVGFRAFAVDRAQFLGLTGYCRNLQDGRVHVVVEGDRSSVDELILHLWKGPGAAEVRAVDVQWTEWRGALREFDVVY